MSANFNYYLNRQGLRGRKGEKGDPGEGVTIEIGQNTSNTFTLLITTQDGTFETPNLRGSLINTTGAGTYLRYDRDTDSIYVASIDEATNQEMGIVRIALNEEVEAGDGNGVITASQLGEVIEKVGGSIKINPVLPLKEETVIDANYAGLTIDEDTGLFSCSGYITWNTFGGYIYATPSAGVTLGVNQDRTGFADGNLYIEFPYELGKVCGVWCRFGASQSGSLIFGTKDANKFIPKVLVYKGAAFNQEAIAVTQINKILGNTRFSYSASDDITGNYTHRANIVSGFHYIACGFKNTNGVTSVSGYFGQSTSTGLVYSYNDVVLNRPIADIESLNCCRWYPAYYRDGNFSDTFLSGIVYGDYQGDITSQSEAPTKFFGIGQYVLTEDNRNTYLQLKYDTNTLGVNGSGALYAKLGTVDDALSTVSENPVQNKVITTSINSITGDISTLQTNVGNLQNTIDGGEV